MNSEKVTAEAERLVAQILENDDACRDSRLTLAEVPAEQRQQVKSALKKLDNVAFDSPFFCGPVDFSLVTPFSTK